MSGAWPIPDDETGREPRPDRLSAADRAFDDRSLIGSFFLSDHHRGWQGCVVAEPAPGVYLVETFEWFTGGSHDQQLVPLADMAGWTFYDTGHWMTNAYDNGVRQRWDRERNGSDGRAA